MIKKLTSLNKIEINKKEIRREILWESEEI